MSPLRFNASRLRAQRRCAGESRGGDCRRRRFGSVRRGCADTSRAMRCSESGSLTPPQCSSHRSRPASCWSMSFSLRRARSANGRVSRCAPRNASEMRVWLVGGAVAVWRRAVWRCSGVAVWRSGSYVVSISSITMPCFEVCTPSDASPNVVSTDGWRSVRASSHSSSRREWICTHTHPRASRTP
jgi:hypothetical protein